MIFLYQNTLFFLLCHKHSSQNLWLWDTLWSQKFMDMWPMLSSHHWPMVTWPIMTLRRPLEFFLSMCDGMRVSSTAMLLNVTTGLRTVHQPTDNNHKMIANWGWRRLSHNIAKETFFYLNTYKVNSVHHGSRHNTQSLTFHHSFTYMGGLS